MHVVFKFIKGLCLNFTILFAYFSGVFKKIG
jgi:hypothetical protein